MPSLVIKDIPDTLHRRIKEEARKHRRSMTQEVLIILEESLEVVPVSYPNPVKGRIPLTQSILDKAIEEGRE